MYSLSREFPVHSKLLKEGVDRRDVLFHCSDASRCPWQVCRFGLCSGNVPKLRRSEGSGSPRQDACMFIYLFGSFAWFFKK